MEISEENYHMIKNKMLKMLTICFSFSLLLLGCTSNVSNDIRSQQIYSNHLDVSPKVTLNKVETVKTGTIVSGSTKHTMTEGNLKVHFIDVGQGASQLIIGPTGKTILIDAGNNNILKSARQEKIDKEHSDPCILF
jgi:beta-lactamase superfamily II metal-dependent hydrolase